MWVKESNKTLPLIFYLINISGPPPFVFMGLLVEFIFLQGVILAWAEESLDTVRLLLRRLLSHQLLHLSQ